jgi:hypothetical protein
VTRLLELAQQLQDSAIGTAIAESRYAFPIIEGLHLVGLSISVGLIFLTDLRLLGVSFREVPLADILRNLRPYVLGGFVLVFLTGGLLVWGEAVAFVQSPATPFKFLFMLLAGVNAAYFECVIAPRQARRAPSAPFSGGIRLAGAASLGLWALVIMFGRLIAYMPN